MGKKIKLVLSTLTIIIFQGKGEAQELIRPGLIRAQLTLSSSYLFSNHESHFYLHCNLEGYLNKRLSLAGEAYYYLGNVSSSQSIFDFNHGFFFGASYHFTKRRSDIYTGLQPGLSITRLNAAENGISKTSTGVNPLFSSILGFNYFVHRIFHFFIQSRIILGEHNYDLHTSLIELRFSAGLGFNLNITREK